MLPVNNFYVVIISMEQNNKRDLNIINNICITLTVNVFFILVFKLNEKIYNLITNEL